MELVSYDKDTGYFIRLVKTNRNNIVGRRVGSNAERGYRRICIDGIDYREHRLAWLYMTGKWPVNEIDHINGRRDDNRFINLREASGKLNSENQRLAKRNNKLGILGVTKDKNSNLYRAVIDVNGKQKFLGRYDSPEKAHLAYLEAKRKYHKGCTI